MIKQMEEIEKLIEEEVERRVNARIEPLLQYIAEKWDISPAHVSKCVSEVSSIKVTTCLGRSKNTRKKCKNNAKENGYCHIHYDQAPKKKEPSKTIELIHTHTLPPFFLKGCPACDNRNRFRDVELELTNE